MMDHLPAVYGRLEIPVIGAPMFLISGPELLLAQCRAGILGSLPALNARTTRELDDWLSHIRASLQADAEQHGTPPAAWAINLIVHRSNTRLDADLKVLEKHRVPVVITSLGARAEVNQAVQAWGGTVLHDVIHDEFARKAIAKGANGLVAVAAGAGGHAGTQNPFALVHEIRQWFDGPLALSGAIATGRAIRAARVLGADFAYVGSAFIATHEANAPAGYKEAIVAGRAQDIIYTPAITGVAGNYLRMSLERAGLDPEQLSAGASKSLDMSPEHKQAKAWRDIWGSGQGIGAVHDIVSVAERVAQLRRGYFNTL